LKHSLSLRSYWSLSAHRDSRYVGWDVTAGLLSRLQGKQPTVYSLMQAAGCKASVKDKDKDTDKNEAAPGTSGAPLVGKSPDQKGN
jgi:hypothetical protein